MNRRIWLLISISVLLVGSTFFGKPLPIGTNSSELEGSQSIVTEHWPINGQIIFGSAGAESGPLVCSDGVGGEIIVCKNYLEGYAYMVAQRVSPAGELMWGTNGVFIDHLGGFALEDICSDGAGGAIFVYNVWEYGSDDNVYAQRISSTGQVLWNSWGVRICIADRNQYRARCVSSGEGEAIITWWDDRYWGDIYAQRILSTGVVAWAENGIVISNAYDDQALPEICSDGLGGAIITWEDQRNEAVSSADIYAQRVNPSGMALWTLNGTAISTASGDQAVPQICTDGAGGAFISWYTYRPYNGIWCQRITGGGAVQWTKQISGADETEGLKTCSDGSTGALLTWIDYRNDRVEIYAQKINAAGTSQWTSLGRIISAVDSDKSNLQICNDAAGGAFIVWGDARSGNWELFAQRVRSTGNVAWTINGTQFTLVNTGAGGQRICLDGGDGVLVTWCTNNDIFGYRLNNSFPCSNHPADIRTAPGRSDKINWTLMDDLKGNKYRIVANNSMGKEYVWINWTPWTNNNPIIVPLNESAIGVFFYRIEYDDNTTQYGVPDIVLIRMQKDALPVSTHPFDVRTAPGRSETITWALSDDFGEGEFHVVVNTNASSSYEWRGWQSWNNASSITVPINRTALGTFNYTIEYYDDLLQYGIADTVIVTIVDSFYPAISLYAPPYAKWYKGIPPNYSVYIYYSDIHCLWYTLDNGATNIQIPTPKKGFNNGTISQIEWNKAGYDVTIKFYQNDTGGNVAYDSVEVYKDTTSPLIVINRPYIHDRFVSQRPYYQITIVDDHYVYHRWYTLDGGKTNYSFSVWEEQDWVNEIAWSNASIGPISLRFYVVDGAGNLGFDEVIIFKESEVVTPELDIHLFITMGIVIINFISLPIIYLRAKYSQGSFYSDSELKFLSYLKKGSLKMLDYGKKGSLKMLNYGKKGSLKVRAYFKKERTHD